MKRWVAYGLTVAAFTMGAMLWFAQPAFRADGQVEPPDIPSPEKHRVGVVIDKLSDTPRIVVGPQVTRTVTYCMFIGGAADESVTLRPIGGGNPSVTVAVGAGQTVGKNFNAAIPAKGFEALTLTPAGDVTVKCDYILSSVP